MHFSFIIQKIMATTGTVWAGLLGLQTSRFDLLEVWDPVLELYVNIIDALEAMQTQLDSIQLEDTSRLDAIEANWLRWISRRHQNSRLFYL